MSNKRRQWAKGVGQTAVETKECRYTCVMKRERTQMQREEREMDNTF